MMIIKIEATETGLHYWETQSHRKECWLDGYIAVPQELESIVVECNGYCDLTVDNDILKNVVARPDLIPTEDKATAEPTTDDVTWDSMAAAITEGVNEV